MEIHNLINKVLVKVAPTSAMENDKITQDARLAIEKLQAGVKTKEENGQELTLKDKAVKLLDTWYVRLGLALSYFVIVKWVQDLMSTEQEPEIQDDYKR